MYQSRANALRNNRFSSGRFDHQRYTPHRRPFETKFQGQNNRSNNKRQSEWPRTNQNFKILYDTENTNENRSRSRSPEVNPDLYRQLLENSNKVDIQALLNKQSPPTDPFAFTPMPVLIYKRKTNNYQHNSDLIWQKKKELQAEQSLIDQATFALQFAEVQLAEADTLFQSIQKTLDNI